MQLKYKFIKTVPKSLFLILTTALFLQFGSGCKKFITVIPPANEIPASTVFNNNGTAAAVLTGIYTNMSANGFMSSSLAGVAFYTALSSDELTIFGVEDQNQLSLLHYYRNELTSSNTGFDFWYNIYPVIFITNSAIEGLGSSKGLTPAVNQQLAGEAKFMRAFCYFYLVNLYGDVPLVTSTDYNVNKLLPRSPKDTVYQQIINDLKDAEKLLSSDYLDATVLDVTSERVRPTKSAAEALLARTYLYIGDFKDAETEASLVINNSMYNLVPLNSVFLKNSQESIWQLQGVSPNTNTSEAQLLLLPSGVGPNYNNFVYLSNNLVSSFDPGDQRKVVWVDSVNVPDTVNYFGNNYYGGGTYFYATKYKVINTGFSNIPQTEYLTVLRLAEQYLIRAEARARLGNIPEAESDLNMIRNRAGLPNTTANDLPSLLKDIEHQRQDELFLEWGDRWLDLKRTGEVDSVMSTACPQKGGTWNTYQQLYPVPLYEIQADSKLVQNAGY